MSLYNSIWEPVVNTPATALAMADLLTVDGAGSGLDADLLDGQHGAYYLPASGGTLTNYKETLYAPAATSGNVTLDLANGNIQRFILGGNHQFTMPVSPGAFGQSFTLILECATYTATWNTSPALKWLTGDGAAPSLATTADYVNVLTFVWDNVDSRWLGFFAGKEIA